MNPKINKTIEEIERARAKITELQELLPELERRKVDLENTEIIKMVRSASIAPADLPEFLEALKIINAAPEHMERRFIETIEAEDEDEV